VNSILTYKMEDTSKPKCKCGKDATLSFKIHSCVFWYICDECYDNLPEDSDDEEIITSK
jgi:hypothetical protein